MNVFALTELKSFISPSIDQKFNFVELVEIIRQNAILSLNSERQNSLGQFFTPFSIAQMMSSMIECERRKIRLLDAGAGAGILTAAFASKICERKKKPLEIEVTAFEIDQNLIPYLEETLRQCRKFCGQHEIEFNYWIRNEDFLTAAAESVSYGLFNDSGKPEFDAAIINPPYGKINTKSEANRLLRSCGIIAPNLYAAFLALCAELVVPNGELVAITPRSFCNGNYFKPFRRYFSKRMSFDRFHIFDSRKDIFDDDILQENIIFHAVKDSSDNCKEHEVVISHSKKNFADRERIVRIKNTELMKPGDKELFIHLGGNEANEESINKIKYFQTSLAELGIAVSTGKVVDFRSKEFLQHGIGKGSAAPLIYPHHLKNGTVEYPTAHRKKFDAIQINATTKSLLVEKGTYVLVKRFSAKEEKRRVTAALIKPTDLPGEKFGFENHLNYFHAHGKKLGQALAKGLTLFLNSSILDNYFRQFSGHTQVNASDLRYLKYPTRMELENLGKHYNGRLPEQIEIDLLIDRMILKNER